MSASRRCSMRGKGVAIHVVLFLLAVLVPAAAPAGEQEKRLSRAVAEYLVAARAVIAENQDLINDATKGEKRFTPERYDELVRKAFLNSANIDLRSLKASTTDIFGSSLLALHRSAMDVIAEYQQRINTPGKGFKGVHPAVVGARIGQELYKRSDIRIKQTSTKYRASYNKPDAFEAVVLKKFEAESKAAPYYEETVMDGKRVA